MHKPKTSILIIPIILLFTLAFLYFNQFKIKYLLKCPIYTMTGIYCPGCGSQRATFELFHLNLWGVLKLNALYFLALLLVLNHVITSLINKYFNKNLKSLLNHKKAPIIILVLTLIFSILRNLPFEPFNWLAPHAN